MIAEKLRRAVIQKAIEGNLFNIESEDKPIVPTYNTKKFYKKEKMYSEFSIPKNWIWTTLSRLFDKEQMNDGDWIVSNDMTEIEEIKLIQLGSIGKGKFINKEFKYISNEKFNELNCKEIKPNYLLFNRIVGGGINACIIPSYVDGKLITSVDALWIKPDININLKFIMYLLLSPYLENQINKLKAGTTRQRISKLNLINIPIPIPNIKIQNIIVEKLEVLLAEIDKLEEDEKALKDLEDKFPEKLKTSILKSAMEGKLTNQLLNDSKTIITIDKKYAQFQQEQIPYTIPENWKWFRVKELFVIRNGFTPLRSNMDFWNSKDVPWFTVNDIRNQGRVITYTDQYISNLAVTDNKVVPKNSILLCCTASIGEYALTKIDLTTNQQFNGMTIKDKYQEFIDIWFVYYWVQTIKEDMISKAGKTTFPFLSVTKLGDFLIPLPPIEEQKRIVEKLDELFRIDLLNM